MQTYTFKVDGSNLTGSVSGFGGGADTPIADGKVTGDTFTFSVTRNGRDGTPTKTVYNGKVVGDKLELTFEFAGRGPTTMTLKKAE
jgi:hypothetical protein